MKQFSVYNNHLILSVAKSPIFVRLILYIITFLCFALPLFGIVFNIIIGNGTKFSGIVALSVFSVMGFFMLRISLWNSFGKEIIQFGDDYIEYVADYYLFKDGRKSIDNTSLAYAIKSVGYTDDNKGVLIVSNGTSEIESVVKMKNKSLEELINILQNM